MVMKRIHAYILMGLTSAFLFGGCEDVNEQFEGIEDSNNPTNVVTFDYQLVAADYATIGKAALVDAETKEDSAKANTIITKNYFSDDIFLGDYEKYIAALIDKQFKYVDNTSSVFVIHNFFEKYDTTAMSSANKYTLTSADYDAMGTASGQPGRYDNFSASIDPYFYLPIWLKQTYPYAKEGDVKLIRYLFYSGSVAQRTQLFTVVDGNWVVYTGVTTNKVKFEKRDGKWVFIDTDILIGLNSNTQIGSNLGNFTAISLVGDQAWIWDSFGYMKMTGYASSTYFDNEDWLISPAMDLSARGDSVFLSFDHVGRYFGDDAGSITNMKRAISVWVSTTSDGTTINPADWTQLEMPDNSYPPGTNWTFVNTGSLKLTNYSGESNVRIAFNYISSAADNFAGTWEVKNVYVFEKP